MKLISSINLRGSDSIYARLISAHKGLSEEQSIALNSRLILIFMNHIGDEEVIAEALELACRSEPDGAGK